MVEALSLCTKLLLLVGVLQIGTCIWVASIAVRLREKWLSVEMHQDSRVLVASIDLFWGPVYVMVPKLCSTIEFYQSLAEGNVTGNGTTAPNTTAEAAATRDLFTVDEAAHIDPDLQDALSQSSEQERRLKLDKIHRLMEAILPGYNAGGHLSEHGVVIDVCNGENETFQPPHLWSRYLSMYTLTRIRGPIAGSLADFREQRRRTFNTLIAGLILCMVAKYGLQGAEVMSRLVGQRYMQVWNGSRTRFDRLLESVLLHGIAVVFTLAMQISMCTVYLQFWRHSHFVMYFIPALGFRIFVGTLALLFLLDLCDRVGHFTLYWSDRKLYIMWCAIGVWMAMIAIPMVGYSITAVQFVIELWWNGWLETEGALYGGEFERLALKAAGACASFLGLALADLCVILSMDLESFAGENDTITTTRLITPSRN